MTHYDVDYKDRETPKFDAVEDIKQYLGKHYDACAEKMKEIDKIPVFYLACAIMGIQGFPVEAWYDHFHGEGAYNNALSTH